MRTSIETFCYDIDQTKCIPPSTTLKEIAETDIIFICLATPMKFNGACHTDLVEEAIKHLRNENSKILFKIFAMFGSNLH